MVFEKGNTQLAYKILLDTSVFTKNIFRKKISNRLVTKVLKNNIRGVEKKEERYEKMFMKICPQVLTYLQNFLINNQFGNHLV